MDHLLIRRKNPFEILMLGVLLLLSIPQLFTGPVSGSVQALMPGWWHIGWLIGTCIGCVCCLWGIFTKRIVDGLYIEWAAIPLVVVSLSALAAAQLVFGGTRALVSAGIVLAIVAAFGMRRRELHKVIAALPKKE